jgi:hypothetical protein
MWEAVPVGVVGNVLLHMGLGSWATGARRALWGWPRVQAARATSGLLVLSLGVLLVLQTANPLYVHAWESGLG